MTGRLLMSLVRADAFFTVLSKINSQLKSSALPTFAHFGVGHLEARILFSLGKDPGVSRASIASRLGLDPALVSRTVKRLQDRELVSADHNRRLTLTESGADLWSEIALVVDARFQRLTANFSASEIEQLTDLLGKLQCNLPDVFDLQLAVVELSTSPSSRAPVLAAQQGETA
jgi:DNA-binding MarR family transcriptional regulator